jgi:hypothetical protein
MLAPTRKMANVYIFVGKPETKGQFGRNECRRVLTRVGVPYNYSHMQLHILLALSNLAPYASSANVVRIGITSMFSSLLSLRSPRSASEM